VIARKTAILFSAATRLGAVLSNASQEVEDCLAAYGQHLGIAFQLIDDALDYKASTEELGKNLGDDLAEGKPTLPLIYAIAQGTPRQAQIVIDAIRNGSRESFTEVYDVVKSTQAIEYTEQQAQQQVQQAVAALACLEDSIYKQALTLLAEFAVQRNH
jgi:octaprenyl-diphosphate synthase